MGEGRWGIGAVRVASPLSHHPSPIQHRGKTTSNPEPRVVRTSLSPLPPFTSDFPAFAAPLYRTPGPAIMLGQRHQKKLHNSDVRRASRNLSSPASRSEIVSCTPE